jgi:hypothetical protein
MTDLIKRCLDFTKYAAAPFFSKTERHIQPTTGEWWEGMRKRIEALQPDLIAAIAVPPSVHPDTALLDWLQVQAENGVVSMCFEMDGGVHVTLDPVGEDQRAARNVETIRDGIQQLMKESK